MEQRPFGRTGEILPILGFGAQRIVDSRGCSEEEAIRSVRELLFKAVEKRLISDVPLGAFLSGGVDSSIIVGIMSKIMKERVKTFSIGFIGDESFDETRYSRIVANKFNTDHTEFKVKPSAF